jgi:hypothetical protein
VPGDGFEPPTRGFSIHGQQAKTMTYLILSNFVSKFCFCRTRGFCGNRGDRCLVAVAFTGAFEPVATQEPRVREMLSDAKFLTMTEG